MRFKCTLPQNVGIVKGLQKTVIYPRKTNVYYSLCVIYRSGVSWWNDVPLVCVVLWPVLSGNVQQWDMYPWWLCRGMRLSRRQFLWWCAPALCAAVSLKHLIHHPYLLMGISCHLARKDIQWHTKHLNTKSIIIKKCNQNILMTFSSGRSVTVIPWVWCHNQERWPSVPLGPGESQLTVSCTENWKPTLLALQTAHSATYWHTPWSIWESSLSLSDCQMRCRALKLTLCLITLFSFPNTRPFFSPFLSPPSACAEMGRWSVCQRKKVTSLHSPLLPSVPAFIRSSNKVAFQAMSLLLKSRALCL